MDSKGWTVAMESIHNTVGPESRPGATTATETTVQDVTSVLDGLAPPALAMDGDIIGLQVGRLDRPVAKVMLALEPSPEVVQLAVHSQCQLLITHHAMLFNPVHCVDTSTARGAAIANALMHGLTVYSAHTNLDIAAGGVNDVLADLLQIEVAGALHQTGLEKLVKLVVFVPRTHHEAVREALGNAGAGHVGGYSHCSFSVSGEGTFLPLAGTAPFVGKIGDLERVDEIRLETVIPQSKVDAVVKRMLAAHPYEEVAYDLYPLNLCGKTYGIGRVGYLPTAQTLSEFATRVRDVLKLSHIRYSGDGDKRVQKVAVVGGAGGDFVEDALAQSVDVLVTADCKHHLVAEAWQDGLAIVDATHAATERPVLHRLKEVLQQRFPDIVIEIADLQEDPFRWL